MKPKRELSLDGTASSTTNAPTADELRTIFARVNPHVPLQAYDDLLSQYAPTPLPSIDESAKKNIPENAKLTKKPSQRKKEGDEMYEAIPSTDIKFLLPGDSLSVYSHKAFPEQFEFTLHYVDTSSGEVKAMVAPHQSKLRSHLTVARPSGPLRASVAGPYNQITFTAPTVSKNALSSFTGSFFKKAGALNAQKDANVELNIALPTSLSAQSSPVLSPAATHAKTTSSAPVTPHGGSPSSTPPPFSAEDVRDFISSAVFTSSLSNSAPNTPTSASRKIAPVALSFRTRVLVNGTESIIASPMFVLCDNVNQVDLFACRVFRNAYPESYPSPSVTGVAPAPKRSSSADSKPASSSTPAIVEKVEKVVVEKVDKVEKVDRHHKHSSSKKEKKEGSSKKTPSSGKSDSSTPATTAAPLATKPCKTEVSPIETSRFAALKFW